MMEKKIDLLKRMVEESTYTVALCGSGMMEEKPGECIFHRGTVWQIPGGTVYRGLLQHPAGRIFPVL